MLVEQLHGVSAMFDKCRAVRYQQGLAKELQLHRKVVVNNKVIRADEVMNAAIWSWKSAFDHCLPSHVAGHMSSYK